MVLEESPAEIAMANRPPKRISIVDDDSSIREAMKNLMRSAQFEADAFASAEEFLAFGRMSNTACLILDVHLPGMNGFELQNLLNGERRGIPVIFITAHWDDASRERALSAGAVEFLSKPVRRESLFRAIDKAMEWRKSRDLR